MLIDDNWSTAKNSSSGNQPQYGHIHNNNFAANAAELLMYFGT